MHKIACSNVFKQMDLITFLGSFLKRKFTYLRELGGFKTIRIWN